MITTSLLIETQIEDVQQCNPIYNPFFLFK